MISSVSPVIEVSKNKFLVVVTRQEDGKIIHEEYNGQYNYLEWFRNEVLRHMKEQHIK